MTRRFYFFERALSPEHMALVSAWERSLDRPSAKAIKAARQLVYKNVVPLAIGVAEVSLEKWSKFLGELGTRDPEQREAAGALWLEGGVCGQLAAALELHGATALGGRFREAGQRLQNALQWTEL